MKTMKKIIFIPILLIFVLKVSAQNTQKIESDDLFNRVYNRNSITFLIISHNDTHDSKILEKFRLQGFDKYNLNKLSYDNLQASFGRNDAMSRNEKAAKIERFLNNNDAGKNIVCYWFNRNDAGEMDLERVKERGLYNANDHEVQVAGYSKRGISKLQDEGINLLKKSYIVVLDITNPTKNISKKLGTLTWTGNVETYLYSVSLGEEIQAKIWDSWIDKNSNLSSNEKQEKKRLFDKIPFTVKYELSATSYVGQDAAAAMLKGFTEAMSVNQKDVEYKGDGIAEFSLFAERAMSVAMESVENLKDDFKVKTAITSRSPIRAKIGTKEGLKKKQMYEVYEGVFNSETKEITSKKVGIVRSTKVVNNKRVADGNSPESKFMIIQQKKKITPYMFIQQKNDKKISVNLDFVLGDNFTHFSIGMNALTFATTSSIYGNLSMDMSFTGNKINSYTYYEELRYSYYGGYYWATVSDYSTESNFSGCLRLGYSLGFNVFNPNLKLEVFGTGGIGFSTYSPYVETVNENTGESAAGFNEAILSYGAKLIYNVKYPIQIYLKQENVTLVSSDTYVAVGLGVQYHF